MLSIIGIGLKKQEFIGIGLKKHISRIPNFFLQKYLYFYWRTECAYFCHFNARPPSKIFSLSAHWNAKTPLSPAGGSNEQGDSTQSEKRSRQTHLFSVVCGPALYFHHNNLLSESVRAARSLGILLEASGILSHCGSCVNLCLQRHQAESGAFLPHRIW